MAETTRQQTSSVRKLAAIMFTDIVGYTAMMGASEEKAMEIRRRNREIHQQIIDDKGGTWLKEMGDGTMASFTTITDAVKSAVEIRQTCKQELDIVLKIGIHLGDVMYEDGDVFGDGVNIASRIQDLAVGGGILISETVYKDIRNKDDFKSAFIGETSLKNVDGQNKIYQLLDGDLVKPTIKIKRSKSKLLGIAGGLILLIIAVSYFVIWPKLFGTTDTNTSIAVLPFYNPTDDESQKHYGVGMATEIRSKLSQSKHFDFISSMRATMGYGNTESPLEIGDELEVRYILSGIYQISGDRIKVDVELIDTQTGAAVWDLSLNELFTDIFLLQSKIASQVFSEFSMTDNQDRELPTQNIEAYGHYLKGLALWSINLADNLGAERALEAEEQLNFAIRKDSSFIDPYVSLVDIKTRWIWENRDNKRKRESEEYANVREEIINLKEYSEKHFSSSWKNILIQARIAHHVDMNLEEGLKLYQQVLNHDPENFIAHNELGGIYKRTLRHQKAISHFSKVRQLNPSDAANWAEIGHVFGIMGDYSSAEKAAENAIDLGMPASIFRGGYLEMGKLFPGAKESNPSFYHIYDRFLKRDFRGLITLYDTAQWATTLDRYYWKATAYHFLGNQDSVKFYGQLHLDNTNQPNRWILAMLGMKEEAINATRENYKIEEAGGFLLATCQRIKSEIELLAVMGEYQEATDLLIDLNRSYPNYGRYGTLFNYPWFDKIKSEYPLS